MAENDRDLLLGGLYDTVLVRFSGEIGIKSEIVRRRLLKHLAENIEHQLERHCIEGIEVTITRARILINPVTTETVDIIHGILQRVYGILSFSYCRISSLDAGEMHEFLAAIGSRVLHERATFAMRVTRDGTHPFSSHDLAASSGEFILDQFADLGLKVNLKEPEVELFIEVRDQNVYLYHEKHKGLGGLPLDVESTIVVPSTDSPSSWSGMVALLKRGVRILPAILLHDVPGSVGGPAETCSRLNENEALLTEVYRVLDLQDRNSVRIAIIPIPPDCPTTLEIQMYSAFALGRYLARRGTRPGRNENEVKAISVDVSLHACSLDQISAAIDHVFRFVPDDMPRIPALMPDVTGWETELDGSSREENSCDPVLDDDLVKILFDSVENCSFVQFDMISRSFLT